MFKQARKEPRQFNFKPRVYDERREEIEKRKKEIAAEMKFEEKLSKDPNARQRVHEQSNYLRFQRRRQARQSNIRLIVILVILLLGTYMMLQRLDLLSQAEGSIF